MKKKILFVWFMICVSICSVERVYAVSHTLKNFFKIHVALKSEWSEVASGKANLAVFRHREGIATINIKAYLFKEEIPTANGLQQRRMAGIYDGWLNLLERSGTEQETAQANVDESYIAVYAKNNLKPDLSLDQLITGEYYYIKEDRAFVITINTNKEFWKKVQGGLQYLIDSFWIGTGERPKIVLRKRDDIWAMPGKNAANQNYLFAQPDFSRIWEKEWEFDSYARSTPNVSTYPVFDNDSIYFSINESLFSISLSGGKINWTYKLPDKINKNLAINDDILYLIGRSNDGEPHLFAVLAKSGSLLYKIKLRTENISDPIINNNKIYLIQDTELTAIDKDAGNTIWAMKKYFDFEKAPVCSGNYVIAATKDNWLIACDGRNGHVIWKKYLYRKIMFTPSIYEDKLIACVKSDDGKGDLIYILDMEKGYELQRWENADNFRITSAPAVGNGAVFVNYFAPGKNQNYIFSYDLANEKLKWRQEIERASINGEQTLRPLVTPELVVSDTLLNSKNALAGMDLLTGEKIVLPIAKGPEGSSRNYTISSIRLVKNKILLVLNNAEKIKVVSNK
ncbi:PQQ-binding-like beta-propeller repeat protein [Candidatus Margulisiibacteriota bacterium]